MPVLVLWGGADRVLLPAHRSFFERHLPGHARLEAMPRAGHVPHMCHPDALAERVLDFVRAC
ncbi:hypothetical protein BAC2_01844 [uncultured bacterium]|nr:hypothetical protein BAC2_01844 [uncultured bacterium]